MRTILSLVAVTMLALPAFADKLVATKYRSLDKRLAIPAKTELPVISPLTERQLLDDGYQPIGVVSVVLRVSHCKTVRECEWIDVAANANREARATAAQHGADVITLWSDNREFVRTRSPTGLARIGVPKDCERMRARTPSGTVLTPGKTSYEVRCTFDSDFVRRTLYIESRGIAWHLGRSEQGSENVGKAVKLLNGLYRKDHDRNYLKAINFFNETDVEAAVSPPISPPSRDDIEETTTLPPLLQAAREGDATAVQFELDRGIAVTTITAYGNTALHFAAAAGHEQIVELLIESGIPWRQRNNNGAPALYLAARYGHLAALTALLDAGANIDEQSLNFIDLTPAMVAAKYGHLALLQTLLDLGAEIDRKDKAGYGVLTHAVAAGHSTFIVPLLARMDAEQRAPALKSGLYVAVMRNKPAAVDVLLQHGALTEYRYGENTPLLIAAAERHLTIVQRLLSAGADPNVSAGVRGALSMVVRSHQYSTTKALENGAAMAMLLLEAGVDPNPRNVIENVRMAKPEEISGHETLIDYLLTDGVLEHRSLRRLFWAAVRAGRIDYMQRITTLANEDLVSVDDPKLLLAAVHSGNIPTVKHVLARAMDINQVLNTQQDTSLLVAVRRLDLPMVTFLLERGADPDRTNSSDRSAISLAYAQDDLWMVRTLSTFGGNSTLGAK